MVAILTKFFGPTNTRGSRVKAYTCTGLQLTISWDHALDSEANHTAAAKALATKMGWHGKYVGGNTEHGYAFVGVARCFDATFTVAKPRQEVK